MITAIETVVEAVERNYPTKPIIDHATWRKGFTGAVLINGVWHPYRKVNLGAVFSHKEAIIQVPTRATLEDVLGQINRIYGLKIDRQDVRSVRIPVIHKGQSRTVALVAREASPVFCGCASIRLVNEETQGD